jgi:APA family basic amino acid/polyamine antiporter
VISLMTVLSVSNAVLLMTPRILPAIGRERISSHKRRRWSAPEVRRTPRVALAVTSPGTAALIMSGTFEEIIAIAAVLFLLLYVSAYAALIVLRRREPTLPRLGCEWSDVPGPQYRGES